MKKLYEVEVELTLYVMAENGSDAISTGRKNAPEELSDLPEFNFTAIRPDYYMANWENSNPYNSDTDQTVKEIVEAEKEAARKQAEREVWEKKQIALPGF